MNVQTRAIPYRIGVTLLNLIAPGLGLLRIGQLRRALFAFGLVFGAVLILIAGLSTTEDISFPAYASLVFVLLALSLTAFSLAIWWTWRSSRQLIEPRPLWLRWYSVIAAMVLSIGLISLLAGMSKSLYRNFYVPSEAMEPTLNMWDRFAASMRPPKNLRRGDIVIVRTQSGVNYVKRLAGLPGDRIAMHGGRVFINGAPVQQREIGVRTVSYPYMEAHEAHVFKERFPGEARFHLIQDLGATSLDDFHEVTVARSHVFMLGDNRDDSADSRVPVSMGGLEQVPMDRVIGRALFTYWPFGKIGKSLGSDGQ